MTANPIISGLYCKSFMLRKYQIECNTEYERHIPLQVQQVKNGIVHPLLSPGKKPHKVSGGVTDVDLNFIYLSLTKRVSPPNFYCEFEDWYNGASEIFQHKDADYIDEDVVFLGALSSHYGHFITEGLSRLWFFLNQENECLKAVYISDSIGNRFLDCFKFFGIEDKNLLEITKPTRFRSVIVPEQSIRLHDFYHLKYKQTIDRIKEKIEPAQYKKVFFSKAKSGNGRGIGELPIQNVFEENGFAIFYPEKMSMRETISVIKGCNEFVATSGTNIHNSIFMNDGEEAICINRSAHFHPLQIMIDRMKKLRVSYIDAFVFSSDKNFGDAPCFLATTSLLLSFFKSKKMRYKIIALYSTTSLNFIQYMLYSLYKMIYSLFFIMQNSKYKSLKKTAEICKKIKATVF